MTTMPLTDKVCKFIEKESLFDKSSRLLVAVSGGVDSMGLLRFLHTRDYKVSVAHINYHLRGDESNQDQQLVESFCHSHDINCFSYELDKEQVTSLKSSNLQEKARDIRYNFFDKVMLDQQLDYLCTAHHADDQVETMFINMTRGSNLTGLTSLKAKASRIRRPFLCLHKSEIVNYAAEHDVPYRLDKSNLQSDYDRNFIRNKVLSPLHTAIPRSQKGLRATQQFLEEERQLRDYYIDRERKKYIDQTGTLTTVNALSSITNHATPGLLLFYLIQDFGFNKIQAELLLQGHGTEERYFYSSTHEGVIKHDQLIIRGIPSDNHTRIKIIGIGSYNIGSGTLTLSTPDTIQYTTDPTVELATIDFTKGPLVVRNWIIGDRFAPYGMNGKTKKLSDLFTELSLNRFEKEQVKLLVQGDQIIWVIGHRLSHHYRVVDDTDPVKLTYVST